MKNKISIFAAASLLASAPIFAADHGYTMVEGTSETLSGLVGRDLVAAENVTISGPSDSALVDTWFEIDQNVPGAGSFTVNNGALVRGSGALSFGYRINVYNSSNAGQGTSTLVFVGTDAEKRYSINLDAESNVGKDSHGGSSLLEFGGYTTVKTGNNIRLDVGNHTGFTGNATLRISGMENNVSISSFNIGDQNKTASVGTAMVEIIGSTHTVTAGNAFRLTGGAGTSVDNIIGGTLSYVADAAGVSAITVTTPGSAGAAVMTGVITLDVSDFVFTGDSHDFQLISTSNEHMLKEIGNWLALIDGGSELFAVFANGQKLDSSDWNLHNEANGLWVSVNAIPEPSACAAAFGALALALAAYRRRK